MVSESKFQRDLISDLERRYPGAIILKNDPNYIQGIPDLLILQSRFWAMLETKGSIDDRRGPNQTYYVRKANNMSFCRFIYPQNAKEVLYDLQQTFTPS